MEGHRGGGAGQSRGGRGGGVHDGVRGGGRTWWRRTW